MAALMVARAAPGDRLTKAEHLLLTDDESRRTEVAALMVSAATTDNRLAKAEEILSINRRTFGARNHHAGAQSEHLLLTDDEAGRPEMAALMMARSAANHSLAKAEEFLIADNESGRPEVPTLMVAASATHDRLAEPVEEHRLIDRERPLSLNRRRIERGVEGDSGHRGAQPDHPDVRLVRNHHGMSSFVSFSAFTQ